MGALQTLSEFFRRAEVRSLAREQGLSDKLFPSVQREFRWLCLESSRLPPELHVLLSDVIRVGGWTAYVFTCDRARRTSTSCSRTCSPPDAACIRTWSASTT